MRKLLLFLFILILPLSANAATCVPSGYTELEYLESTGTQYIDTGYKPKPQSFGYYFDLIAYNSSQLYSIAGTYDAWAPGYICTSVGGNYSLLYGNGQDGLGDHCPNWNANTSNVGGINSSLININERGFISVVNNNDYDGTQSTITTTCTNCSSPYVESITFSPSAQSRYNFLIYGINSHGTPAEFAKMRLYNAKLYEYSTPVRNFIPARRNSDSVLGLYDTVTGTFFTNAGTGTFTAGPDVSGGICTCAAGYWNNNGTCTVCDTGVAAVYCPGDDNKYNCPNEGNIDYETLLYNEYGFTLGSPPYLFWAQEHNDISDCVWYHTMMNEKSDQIYFTMYYSKSRGYYWDYHVYYYRRANTGYYLINNAIPGQNYYYGVTECTNKPANSHYTGAGTPEVGDCPWVCDDGYYGSSANGDSSCTICSAGYACANGVKTNCANVTGPNGRLTYSDTGASSCTECPAVTGALASRVSSYWGWWNSENIHNGAYGCYATFMDSDDDADFSTLCYYSTTDGAYGGAHSTCQTYRDNIAACAAGKYKTIESTPEYQSRMDTSAVCNGVDCMKGRVCTDVGTGYYSPVGDLNRYACTNKPANSSYSASGTSSSCPWTCDTNYWEYSNACHARCPYGDGELHVGEYTHPLWADITNVPSPSVYIGELGPNHDGLCYAYLEPDDTPVDNHHGFHTVHNGVPYHAINLGLYGLE